MKRGEQPLEPSGIDPRVYLRLEATTAGTCAVACDKDGASLSREAFREYARKVVGS